jgi:L-malate glycosyltransferase
LSVKPNILQLIGNLDQGGTERQAIQLTGLLQRSGFGQIHVACLDAGGPLREDLGRMGFTEIPEFPLKSFRDVQTVRQLRRFATLLRERKIDILQTHDFYTNIFGMAAGPLARVPVRIASRRSMRARRSWAQHHVEIRMLGLAHAVIANSAVIRKELMDAGVKPEKIHVIHNGLETERLAPPRNFDRAAALRHMNLPSNGGLRFVTIVANMRHDVKDYPTFLRAARQVREAVPDAAFVLAGEGPLMGEIRGEAHALGLAEKTFLVGGCKQVAELLAVSDVCVLSSRSEGFSNSILEYMAAGKPAVVTDVGGAREAIEEGKTGFLVPAGDDRLMAARIIDLLRDPGGAQAIGQRAQASVGRRFSCQSQLERVCALYSDLLKQSGKRR